MISQIDSFPEGARLPTEIELAERFGISRLTVHRVMSDLQQDGYVVRLRAKGTFVTRRDQRVRSTQTGHRGTVIIAYADWFSYDTWSKIDYAELQAVKHGYSLVQLKLTRLGGFESLPQLVEEYDDVRGVLVIPPGGCVAGDERALLDSLGVPVVVLSELDNVLETRHLVYACQDMDALAAADVDYAVRCGAKKLAFIDAEPPNAMLARFRDSLTGHGDGRLEILLPPNTSRAWQDSPTKAYQLARQVLGFAPSVDALVLNSFTTALAASRAIHDAGLDDQLLMILNAPYFGMQRFLRQRTALIYCSLREIVAQAFDLIAADPFPPDCRFRLVDAEVEIPEPSDPAPLRL